MNNEPMTLDKALATCEQASPAPWVASRALQTLRTHMLAATAIADHCARADIESQCRFDDGRMYHTEHVSDPECTEVVAQALAYLTLRGDELPFSFIREGSFVRFEAKP